jgi:hypothetical protein
VVKPITSPKLSTTLRKLDITSNITMLFLFVEEILTMLSLSTLYSVHDMINYCEAAAVMRLGKQI